MIRRVEDSDSSRSPCEETLGLWAELEDGKTLVW